jgi:hypothetical protein
MRPLVSIAAFALLLTVPLCAQRGGGHAGGFGGARGGFGGARGVSGVRSGGGHFSGGMHSGYSHASSSRGFNSHASNRGTYSGRGSHNGSYNNGYRHRHYCYGWQCGHPGWDNRWSNRWWGSTSGWGWGSYDPWLGSSWDYDDYRFDRDYYRERAQAQEWNEQNLAEVRVRREEEEEREPDAHARRSYSRQNAEPQQTDEQQASSTPTVLIFRDRRQKEVSNYAIVGQNLLDLTPQHHEKIPLANLDLQATAKANDDRGVTFRVPGSQEGQ